MLLKNQWVNNDIKEEIFKNHETNNNENLTIPNLWNKAKAVLRGKYRAIQVFLKNKENLKQPNLPPKKIRKRINKT